MIPPKVFFIGCDKGAWAMRGRQMAQAMPNARYGSKPNQIDWLWPDVVVLVKRAAEVWWKEAAASGKPIIWDALDFWKQPEENHRLEDEHLGRVRQIAKECGASLLIGATKSMAKAIGGLYLPHHSRLGLKPTAPRSQLQVVGYDGSPRYLGSWRGALERTCRRLGVSFVINPADLSRVDLLVSFRGEEWDGWVCREWKSGVKYVNAIAAGRPILTQRSAAFAEIRPEGTVVEFAAELEQAIAEMRPIEARQMAYEHGLKAAPAFTVESIARRYDEIIRNVLRKAA